MTLPTFWSSFWWFRRWRWKKVKVDWKVGQTQTEDWHPDSSSYQSISNIFLIPLKYISNSLQMCFQCTANKSKIPLKYVSRRPQIYHPYPLNIFPTDLKYIPNPPEIYFQLTSNIFWIFMKYIPADLKYFSQTEDWHPDSSFHLAWILHGKWKYNWKKPSNQYYMESESIIGIKPKILGDA